MEQKEEKSDVKAQLLINTFKETFYKMSYTIHPLGIPGEAQGKSSNESWAAKQACKDYPDGAIKQDVIITTMDGGLCCPKTLQVWRLTNVQRTHISHRVTSNRSRDGT